MGDIKDNLVSTGDKCSGVLGGELSVFSAIMTALCVRDILSLKASQHMKNFFTHCKIH